MLAAILFLIFNNLSRVDLLIFALYEKQIDFVVLDFLQVLLYGFINDCVTLCYFAVPIALFTFLFKNINKYIRYCLYFILIQILCFLLISEFTFWLEFSNRFNFIAVDYLVYTHEVIGNIQESYPIFIIFPLMILGASIVYYKIHPLIHETTVKAKFLGILALLSSINFFYYEPKITDIRDNNYLSELSKNGIYNLFSAYLHNSIDFYNLYQTRDTNLALKGLYKFISNGNKLERDIKTEGPAKEYNVILITVESLSADFFNIKYEDKPITPFLNEFIKQGMYFNNFYATGTRTVRGLEAITLSIPPLPGQSILRRENNEHLFSIASVLKKEKYDLKFIYGGYGYFDNMNYFFEKNGFESIDRNKISEKEINFANIWGISDEDLYTQVIKQADQSYNENKKFFSLVMTTSNHRPYTYPEGKIDIPSHSNRQGGVKYSDYALKEFMQNVSKKPWFDNTIFIITADHCAGSAGKTALPPKMYHIPLLIYAPKIIKPQTISKLSSQIDLAPTILGLLNVSYKSKFFGSNILTKSYENAFISTFQKLGYIENNSLVVLSPSKNIQTYKLLNNEPEPEPAKVDSESVNRAIDYYQSAYYLYQNGLLKEHD